MGNPPVVLVGWMVSGMLVVGAGLTWDWSWWGILSLGGGLLGAAYWITQKNWKRTCDKEEKVRDSIVELQNVMINHASSPSRSASPESVGADLNDTVNHIQQGISHLEEERANMSAIVQNLVEGVVAFDSHGHVIFGNSSACQMLKLDEYQLQGRSVWEVIRSKDLAELVERSRTLELHERQRAEVNIHAPSPMIVEVYGLPFPLANQKKGSVIVLYDVTQLRRLEQVRAEFMENVSHELRTPLAAIIGYLETVIDEPSLETPNTRKFIQVAHQHAERLNRLVDDLRSLSEIESGNVVLRWESVGLKDVVDEVTEMLQTHGKKKSLEFRNQIAEGDCVWADRDRVVQILVNLVDNAIKYSSEGGHISFLAQRLDTSVVLQVKDTGQGIPSTDLSRITERFYRVDRARSREEGGTGLGLSIVKHLVQLLKGQLRIQSELGKGTTVEIVLRISST